MSGDINIETERKLQFQTDKNQNNIAAINLVGNKFRILFICL